MKIIQVPAGFELMNHSFTVAALTHWATLFGKNLGKRQFINFLLNFLFILIGSSSQYGCVPYHLKV